MERCRGLMLFGTLLTQSLFGTSLVLVGVLPIMVTSSFSNEPLKFFLAILITYLLFIYYLRFYGQIREISVYHFCVASPFTKFSIRLSLISASSPEITSFLAASTVASHICLTNFKILLTVFPP